MITLTIFRAIMYYSGIVAWVAFLFCCFLLFISRKRRSMGKSNTGAYEKEIVQQRASECDKKFTLILEKYLDGEAKATQYE